MTLYSTPQGFGTAVGGPAMLAGVVGTTAIAIASHVAAARAAVSVLPEAYITNEVLRDQRFLEDCNRIIANGGQLNDEQRLEAEYAIPRLQAAHYQLAYDRQLNQEKTIARKIPGRFTPAQVDAMPKSFKSLEYRRALGVSRYYESLPTVRQLSPQQIAERDEANRFRLAVENYYLSQNPERERKPNWFTTFRLI